MISVKKSLALKHIDALLVFNIFRSEERYVKQEWANVYPGDFVHLSCNEIIPADILLLRSSDPGGICHVETSNIDGENNLKQRQKVSCFDTEVCCSTVCTSHQYHALILLCFFPLFPVWCCCCNC